MEGTLTILLEIAIGISIAFLVIKLIDILYDKFINK